MSKARCACGRKATKHHRLEGPMCFRCFMGEGPYLARSAVPSRKLTAHDRAPPQTRFNSWERGIPTDSKGMPFLDEQGSPVGMKEFVNRGGARTWRQRKSA